MRKIALTSLILALMIVATGCLPTPGPTPTPRLKGEAFIYVVAPRTGTQAYGGDDVAGGVKLRVWEANQKGGVAGYRLTVREANDQADPDTASQVAQDIVGAIRKGDKVIGVVGNYNSSETKASLKTFQDLGAAVVLVTNSSSNPQLRGDYFFRVCATDAEQGPADARFLVQSQGAKRIAVLHTQNDYATGLRDEFVRELGRLGVQPAIVVALKEASPSFKDKLTPARSANPEALFFAGDFPDGQTLLLDLQAMGWRPAIILLSDANFVFEVPDTAGKAAEGVYVSAISPDPRAVTTAEWAQAYRQVVKHDPGVDAVTGYQAADVILRGFEKTNGSFDGKALANAIRGLDYNSLIGRVKYNAEGNLVEQKVFIFQIKNGDFVQAWPAK